MLARTNLGRPSRVLLAGHTDTVPAADNLPSRLVGGELYGCGTSDMKSGDAVFLHLAATVAEPSHDITLVMYDCEEIESSANGLGRIERELPDWLRADVAILGEPSGGFIEAGCQGTIRVVVRAAGTRAHSARSWLGDNAIHKLGAVLDRLSSYRAAQRRHRRLHVPRGAVRGAHRRRHRGQRHPRRRVGHGELPLRARPQRRAGARRTSARCSTGSTSTIELTDAAAGRAARADQARRRRAGAARRAGRCAPSTAGPTWRGSPRWASPPSTTVPATRTWRTASTSACDVAQITAATEMLRKYLLD